MAFPSNLDIEAIVLPIITRYGLDLEGIKVSRAGKKSVVAIAVDGDQRVDSDRIEILSGEISQAFDKAEENGAINFGPGYTLEVGTPGVDQPLTKPRHWRRNRGRKIILSSGVGRIGALDDTEERVIIIRRVAKKLVVDPVELVSELGAVVDIEFAKSAADELELAAMSFDEAISWREENK
ncbi:ribosome maturation factor RimP [Corynebacterium kutscheri]|uniref:ribosome maturation factor RimP n=1 Tax=Corynebacterium kutscheri TaxID=35755 RepID=UPI0037BEF6FA